MTDNKDKISPLIPNQIPSHIRENYELYTKFIVYYYEYMEETGNPINLNFNFLRNTNLLDTQNQTFYTEIAKRFGSVLPQDTTDNNRMLVQKIAEFYRTKGTQASFNFIFNLLFDEVPSEYYTPKDDIFTLSTSNGTLSGNKFIFDGEYFQDHSYQLSVSNETFEKITSDENFSSYLKFLLHPIGTQFFLRNEDTNNIVGL